MLEKRENLLAKKIASELDKARALSRQGNKRSALQCLKRKKLYEQQIESLAQHQLKLQEQVIMLEGSKATAETFGALRSGAGAMKQLAKETNVEDVDATMDMINEQTDKMRQVQEALGQPMGLAAEIDEDELEEELAELDALDVEDKLLERELEGELEGTTMPSVPLPTVPIAPQKSPRKSSALDADEDAELKALQREMELL